MDARNYIYRMEWADFQLDVILPADVDSTADLPLLDNPEIRTLPYGAITVNTLEWGKYEAVGGLPIGIPNPAVLKLTLDLTLLPADITTVLFEDPAKYPLKDAVESPDLTNLGLDIGKGNRGIVFSLYQTGDDLIQLFEGIYLSDGSVKINYSTLMMEIEAKSVIKYALDNITHVEGESLNKLALDYAVTQGKVLVKPTVYEFNYSFNNKYYVCQSNEKFPAKERKILVCSLTDFTGYINNLIDKIRLRLMRYSQFIYFSLSFGVNYKQQTDMSGARAAQLVETETYLLIGEIYDEKIVGGILNSTNPDNTNSIFSFYKGGLWDFVRDIALESLLTYQFNVYGIYPEVSLWREYSINLKYHKFSELILRDDPIKVVTASLYESASDTGDKTYQDVNKYDRCIPGSENEASTTVPIIFNTLPPQLNYKKYERLNGWPTGSQIFAREGNKFFNLYYIKGAVIERVHESAKFPLNLYEGINKSSDDYRREWPVYINRDIHNGHLYENIQYMQLITGNGIAVADTLLALLGKGSNKLTGVEFDFTEDFIFIHRYCSFNFDFSSFFLAVPEDLTRRWMMNSCKIDFIKEIATCDFIELNV